MKIKFYGSKIRTLQSIAESIPATLEQIKEITKIIRDNKLKLKLTILANNYNLLHTKLNFYFTIWGKEKDEHQIIAKECLKSIDYIITWIQELAQIVVAKKIGERYEMWTQNLNNYSKEGLKFIKEHPEVIASKLMPFGFGAATLSAGLISAGKKLLESRKK